MRCVRTKTTSTQGHTGLHTNTHITYKNDNNMVMELTPLGNATHVCAGLELREAQRLPMSQSARDFNLALFIVFAILSLFVAAGIWKTRQHPRFAKVRPVQLSFASWFAALLYVSGGTLSFALDFPTIYIVIAILGGINVIVTVFIMRGLILLLEIQYARVAAKKRIVNQDTESTASTTKESSVHRMINQCSAFNVLLRLVCGRTQLFELTIQDAIEAKSAYHLFAFLFSMIGISIILIVVLVVPTTCDVPGDVFLELQLAMFSIMPYAVPTVLRVLWLSHVNAEYDSQGTISEIMQVELVCCLIFTVIIVLAIVDPGDLAYNRVFNWQCLGFLVGVFYYWFTFGLQFREAWRMDHRAATEEKSEELALMMTKMRTILAENAEIREAFQRYATTMYVAESLQFLEDVAQFKQLFYEKNGTWRTSKVQLLVKNYIAIGADLEVNISSRTRETILQRAKVVDVNTFSIFDEAQDQVEGMLQNGAWRTFLRKRRIGMNIATVNSRQIVGAHVHPNVDESSFA